VWSSKICTVVCILAAGVLPAFAQHESTESEIEAGKTQYVENCVRCHGPGGDAIPDVDLGHGKFRRATTDADLVAVLVGEVEHPRPHFSSVTAQTIVAYLRSIAASAAGVASLPPGDPVRGKAIFEVKGACNTCHRVGPRGSRAGPDLSQIGAQRRPVELQRSIIEPDAEIIPANRYLRIVTKDGTAFTGRLLNQDAFSVQILDVKDEKLKSLTKSNLREYALISSSTMPSYKNKLSVQELADLISYLTSLKGPS
jgi:putative heme-binding domain-containing protein